MSLFIYFNADQENFCLDMFIVCILMITSQFIEKLHSFNCMKTIVALTETLFDNFDMYL